MSKNFNPKYTVDLTNITDTEALNLAIAVGKLKESYLNPDDLAVITNKTVLDAIDKANAQALVIYRDGKTEFVTDEKIDRAVADAMESITDLLNACEESFVPKKKEPWYKRFWHKIFPKKNK